jgi:hypothetical protein
MQRAERAGEQTGSAICTVIMNKHIVSQYMLQIKILFNA